MRQFIFSIIFVLTCSIIFASGQTSGAKLLEQLLDFPAPRPEKKEPDKDAEKPHPDSFYDSKNIPRDDAPAEELLDYWKFQNSNFDEFRYNLKPSKETLKRIIKAVEDDPMILAEYLSLLPADTETGDLVKRLYENALRGESLDASWLYKVKSWLKYNSDMFIGELLQEAREVNNTSEEERNPIQNQEQLISLAKIDWDQAGPLIEQLESTGSDTPTFALAQYVLYHHALAEESKSATEKYRARLQKIVENKKASHKARDLAMDALVLGGDFDGRSEWYLSLLEDETLLELQENGFTGLTTLPRHSPNSREQWIPEMTRLIQSDNRAVRSAAVRNLLKLANKNNPEIVKLLLPWLTDPEWVKQSGDAERQTLLEMLGEMDMPESVPGLISVVMREDGGMRSAAAKALVRYKSPEAISALKYALQNESDSDYRESIIGGLMACGGLSPNEQLAGLEAYAGLISTEEGREALYSFKYGYNDEDTPPLSAEVSVGEFLSNIKEPSGELAYLLIKRVEVLRRTNPPVAGVLLGIMQKWNHRLIDLEMFKWLEQGTADADSVLHLLAKREDIRKNIAGELFALGGKNSLTRGLSAVIAADGAQMAGILKSGDAEAQTALLAAARLTRTKLYVGDVAPLLNSSDKLLALAAERYLESEDSVEARRLILAKNPAEVRILGARQAFIPDSKKNYIENEALDDLFRSVTGKYFQPGDDTALIEMEDRFRNEIKESAELQAVYAFIGATRKQEIIRVFKNKITYTTYEDEAHFLEKNISGEDYEILYRYLVGAGVDSLGPLIEDCEYNCPTGEFIMFGRGGGRRVYFRAGEIPKPLAELAGIFEKMGRENTQLRYRLADKLKGLEILLADEDLVAHAVWKNGDDLRVLVLDSKKAQDLFENIIRQERLESLNQGLDNQQRAELQRKRRERIVLDVFSWRRFDKGKLTEITVPQPEGVVYLSEFPLETFYNYSKPQTFQRQFGGFEFRTSSQTGNDLVKINSSGTPFIIKEGIYNSPLVLPDGRWVIAAKRDSWSEPAYIVRVNLQTGKEFKVNIEPAEYFRPISFIPSQNKVLVSRYKAGEPNGQQISDIKSTEYYLLDAATGAVQKTKGEFRPLFDQTYRGLQPTGKPDEFWAAIYDEEKKATDIGRYNTKTFKFETVLNAPEIKLDSMDIWVDEKEGKIYFVYRSDKAVDGHLLSLPLPE